MTRAAMSAALGIGVLMGAPTISAAPSGTGPSQRTARHCLVALGTIRDYRVPGARYDVVIVSPEPPLEAALSRARRAHPGALVLGYLNTMDMNDLVPGAAPILKRHEDWFLHDARGRRVGVRIRQYTGRRTRYGMNVGHSGYQDYLAGRAVEILEAGYDGVHLDNVETDSSYHPRHVGSFISAMPVELDHDSWPTAVRAMLARIRRRVTEAGFGAKPLVINDIRSGEPEVSRLYLREVEGANCENWLGRDRPHDGPFGWKAKVDQAAEVSRTGKMLNLICRTPSVAAEESMYLFASYLLALEGDRLYFYHGSSYRPEGTRWHDFYDLDIGRPEERMSSRDGIYVRRFTKGYVAVNPFDRSVLAPVPVGYVDLTFEPVETLDLKPRSAAILLRSRNGLTRRAGYEAEDLPARGSTRVEDRAGASGGRVVRLAASDAAVTLELKLEEGTWRIVFDGFPEGLSGDACFVQAGKVEKRIYFASGHRPYIDLVSSGESMRVDIRAAEPGVMLDRVIAIRLAGTDPP